jgi:hypothetical protein
LLDNFGKQQNAHVGFLLNRAIAFVKPPWSSVMSPTDYFCCATAPSQFAFVTLRWSSIMISADYYYFPSLSLRRFRPLIVINNGPFWKNGATIIVPPFLP